MKRLSVMTAGLLVTALTVFGCATTSSDSGWVTLLDGPKGLENFDRVGASNWAVVDGVVQADRKADKDNGYLVSKNAYRDFQIRAEFTNIFNRTQMNNPTETNPLATPTRNSLGQTTDGFGYINVGSTFSAPRQGQLVARFQF